MANTLVEYKNLVADALKAGIAETIYLESPWLKYLPFKSIAGVSLKYKMELSAAAADFQDVGGTWIEGTPTWDYRNTDLYILGGDADVDAFTIATMGTQENIEADIISLKAKAIAQRFEACAILGRTTAVATYSASNIFKGLIRKICECEGTTDSGLATDLDGSVYTNPASGNNTQVLLGASNASAALTLDMLDALIGIVKPAPSHLVMARIMRNKISSLARAAGNNLTHDNDELGMPVVRYGDQIILVDDAVPINANDQSTLVAAPASYTPTTPWAAGNDTSPIFAVRIAEDGLCGLSNGMIQVDDIGKLETKDAERTRIKFYCGLALFNKRAAGVLWGTNVAG